MTAVRRFARLAICCCTVAPVACGSGEKSAADSAAAHDTAAAAAAPAPPAAISLADVAGKWNVRATPENSKDTSVTEYVLNASADSTKWTIVYKGRAPVKVHVTTSGDSIVTDAGPYESFRRKGVQVSTHGVLRLQDGKLVGRSEARYKTRGPDTLLHVRTEGTKAQ